MLTSAATATRLTAAQTRAGVYGRESKDKKKSVDDQITLGVAVIQENDWAHVRTYSDGSSASRFATKARDDWADVLADIQGGVLDMLLLWESSRGSREPIDWFTFLNACRDHGVLIHIIGDEETFDVRKAKHYKSLATAGVDAAYESDRTSERVLRGVRATATKPDGATPHGNTPYGYARRLRNPEIVVRPAGTPWEEFYVQVPDPTTAPVVREIFVRIARNTPISELENDLNARGIPGPKGGLWLRQTIRNTIRRVSYLGHREHQGVEYEACWKPLVHPATFRAANRVLDAADRRGSKPGKKRWLLSYLALAPCGGPLKGQPKNAGRRDGYHCQKDGCVGIGVAELDEYVTRLIVVRLSQPDARDMFLPDDDAVTEAKEEADALRDELKKATEAFKGRTGMAATVLAELVADLEPQIIAAEQRAIDASASAALVELITADDVRKVWDGLPLAGRREVITKVLDRIEVGRPVTRITRHSTDRQRVDAASERVSVEWASAA